MKKLMIAISVAGVLVLGAFAAVSINSSGTAVAQSDGADSNTAQTETPTTTDADVPVWVDDVLNGLVEGEIITESTADELRTEAPTLLLMLDQAKLKFGTDANGEDGGEEYLPFDIERFRDRLDGFELPEGLDGLGFFGPEGFDLEGLTEQFRNFNFDSFELPEGLDHPNGISPESFGGFGFLDGMSGLSFSDLRDAMQNGTLDELLDTDAIVSQITEKLDAAVTEGDLTREQADRMLERLTEKLDAIANGELPFIDHGSEDPSA